MTAAKYRKLKRQAGECGISFRAEKWSSDRATNVPLEHRDKFAAVQLLGRTRVSDYRNPASRENVEKPWQVQNITRAKLLVDRAVRCRGENRNEAGWRTEVETKLLERFNIEVACNNCRKRLWRSEIEADPSASNSRTTSLMERQRRRKQCTCSLTERSDYMDPGMSELFSSRTEETVHQPGQSGSRSLNPQKQPDRIQGLRLTQNFKDALQKPYTYDDPEHYNGRLVGDVIHSSVTVDSGEPLLFPFLVSEAKGEKGAENFECMEVQTAFPIKYALELQYDLIKTRGNTEGVPGGPLVWFLANRGEDWRVYGAVVHEQDGRSNYLINHLWSGSITGLDEALQLILIVDYILDWARDIYRPNILRQLKSLGMGSSDDVTISDMDPDVYSTREESQPWMELEIFESESITESDISVPEFSNLYGESLESLGRFKTPQGLIRDARFIQSRLRGLYITCDNVQTFLQGFDNTSQSSSFARRILTTLGRRCMAFENELILKRIEDKWTGHFRASRFYLQRTSKVYAQFRVSYFITPGWEQVRELTYVAVSEDAREILIQAAKLNKVSGSHFTPPECSEAEVIRAIDGFLDRSVRHDFISALARRTFSMNLEKIPVVTIDDDFSSARESMASRMVIKLDKKKSSPGVLMNGIVYAVYSSYRVGKREPSESFLRLSDRVDYSGRSLWRGWQEGDTLSGDDEHLDTVLVYGGKQKTAPYRGPEQSLSLWVLDGQPQRLSPWLVAVKLLWYLSEDVIYGTICKGKVYRNSRNWEDNQPNHYFMMNESKDQLKISKKALRWRIFAWINAMNAMEGFSFGTRVAELEPGLRGEWDEGHQETWV